MAKLWKPLVDGQHDISMEQDRGTEAVVRGDFLEVWTNLGSIRDDVRLCQLVEEDQAIPARVAVTGHRLAMVQRLVSMAKVCCEDHHLHLDGKPCEAIAYGEGMIAEMNRVLALPAKEHDGEIS